MDLPATHRVADGVAVETDDARRAWAEAAAVILRDVAATYNATITYADLSERVQDETGIRTRQLMRYWIGKVLFIVAVDAAARDEPILSSLCVRSNGSVGMGYGEAIDQTQGSAPEDLEMHAASERLACYRLFNADLPADGGRPTLTAGVVAQRRRSEVTQRRSQEVERRTCPSCHMQLSMSGDCSMCE